MRATLAVSFLIAALGVSSLRADTPEPFLIDGMPPLAPDTRRETLQATDGSWHDCMVFTRITPDSQGSHNACWIHATNTIHGHLSNNPRGAEHLKSTIGHEIGHIFVGKGHPGLEEGGPAPLAGTDHRQRLMAGGELVPLGGIRSGKLLVKAEWDAAEAWLKKNIDEPTP